jgi:hypothetical protein
MPQRKPLCTAGRRRRSGWDEWDAQPAPVRRARRLGKTLTFVVACAFGAALSAGATNQPPLPPEDLAPASAPGDPEIVETIPATAPAEPLPAETAPTESTPPEPAPPEPASVSQVARQRLAEPELDAEPAPPTNVPDGDEADSGAPAADPAPGITVTDGPHSRRRPAPEERIRASATSVRQAEAPDPRPRARPRQPGSELEPEARAPGVDATIWLHRSLPDPTPPSKRLRRSFAANLQTVARASSVDWAFMLGLLRAEGRTGAVPAGPAELRTLASRLSLLRGQDEASVALALAGSEERADRAVALAHYHRAVSMRALVRGLEWAKPRLEARLLRDDRVATYDGGRLDIASGQVDVRVLALIAYLADAYGEVTVSSLKTGHRLYSRPGVMSAHAYGLAVDIAALGGIPIAGNQEPGGLTEDAVRSILLLPSELQPRQVISLLGLGGPSFALGDHGDHIHVGY